MGFSDHSLEHLLECLELVVSEQSSFASVVSLLQVNTHFFEIVQQLVDKTSKCRNASVTPLMSPAEELDQLPSIWLFLDHQLAMVDEEESKHGLALARVTCNPQKLRWSICD